MDRFFAEALGGAGSRLVLSPEETRHLKVRRVAQGDEVRLFDGAGHEASARLMESTGRGAVVEVLAVLDAPPDVAPLVTVASAIPKGRRMADLVRACTEVGASRIVPVVAARSVVRPETGERRERWVKIAREAAKQSRRGHVPEVAPVSRFEDVVALAAQHDVGLVADAAAEMPLRDALEGKPGVSRALVLVGPEGGFTEAELDAARSRGLLTVRLPVPVMRVETAAPVLVASIILACS